MASSCSNAKVSKEIDRSLTNIRLAEEILVTCMVMDNEEISHQQSLVQDSFSTIERLESEMASITKEFESLDQSATKQEEDQDN